MVAPATPQLDPATTALDVLNFLVENLDDFRRVVNDLSTLNRERLSIPLLEFCGDPSTKALAALNAFLERANAISALNVTIGRVDYSTIVVDC